MRARGALGLTAHLPMAARPVPVLVVALEAAEQEHCRLLLLGQSMAAAAAVVEMAMAFRPE